MLSNLLRFSRQAARLAPAAAPQLSAARSKHTLPDLPYKCSALEPVISQEIMELHHSKHHATYVNNLNAAEEQLRECVQQGTGSLLVWSTQHTTVSYIQTYHIWPNHSRSLHLLCTLSLVDKNSSIQKTLTLHSSHTLPTGDVSGMIAMQGAIKFNGGGHLNHSIFWNNLSPSGGGSPSGELATAIERDFGSFDNFKTQLSAKTVAIQGSGWGWLVSVMGVADEGCVGGW